MKNLDNSSDTRKVACLRLLFEHINHPKRIHQQAGEYLHLMFDVKTLAERLLHCESEKHFNWLKKSSMMAIMQHLDVSDAHINKTDLTLYLFACFTLLIDNLFKRCLCF